MAAPYVEFYGTLPDGTVGPAIKCGLPAGGSIAVTPGADGVTDYTQTLQQASGTIALLTGINQTWGTYEQDFTAGSVLVPTMPFGDSSTNAASTEFVLTGLNTIAPIHSICQAGSQTNISIAAPGATIDGYSPAVGDRILLVGQTSGAQNGPWEWNGAAVPMTRPIDWPTGAVGVAIYGVGFDIINGTINGGSFWYVITTGAVTIDTTPVTFTMFAWNMSNGFVQNIMTVAHGGTGLATVPTNQIPYGNGTGALVTSGNLIFNGSTLGLSGTLLLYPNAAGVNSGEIWTDSTQKALGTVQSGLSGMLPQVIFTSTASATVANTVTPTSIIGTGVGTKTLPANWAVVGKQLVIDFEGVLSETGTPALTFDVRLGSTVIASGSSSSLIASLSNDRFSGRVILTFRTIGGTGTVFGGGLVSIVRSNGNTTSIPINATAAVTVDTTASQVADVFITWGTANASNTITGQQARYTTGN